jgi:WD40 repeat protein
LATSPDGLRVATCGNDRKVKLWDSVDCKLVHEFSGHSSHVYNLVFSRDSKNLYSCDLKGIVKQWPVEPDGGQAELAARDVVVAETLAKYDTTFRADIGGARSMALKPDGSQLALGGITNVTNAFAGVGEVAVVLVDLAQSKVAVQLEAKEKIRGAAWGVDYHPAGFWIGLSAGGGGGWLYFWKGDVPHEFFKLKLKTDGRGMSMSPDATQLAVAHYDQHLRTYGSAT